MQIGFPLDRERAVVGQKVDSTPATIVSVSSKQDSAIPYGVLLAFDGDDPFLCQLPTMPEQVAKPIGISIRQLYGLHYEPQTPIAIMRQGRIWVLGEDVKSPGDPVFIKLSNNQAIFTGLGKDNVPLKGAVFLEGVTQGLVPIEINFSGGAR